MDNPLISVIVPAYNVAPFLGEAVDSVLQQTYSNWEILLVNDGSTDETPAIARQYAQRYSGKIKFLEHPGGENKGLTASRNLAVHHAKGSWVALLDSDDFWMAEKLACQLQITRDHPGVSMVCCASLMWHSWADASKEDTLVPVGGPQDQEILPPLPALRLYPLGDGSAPCPSGILIKKETLLRHQGFEENFTGKYQFYEDQAFLTKIYLHEPIYTSSRMLIRYRQRKDSIMSRYEKDYANIRLYYLSWLSEYLGKEKKTDLAVRKKLKAALWPYDHPVLFKIKRLWRKQ